MPLRRKDLKARAGSGYVGMQDVPAFLRQAATLDKTALGNALRSTTMPLHWIVPSNYRGFAYAARRFVTELRDDVRLAESQPGWPEGLKTAHQR
jgi:hypothetical protein